MSASIRWLLAQNNGKVRLLEAHDLKSMEIVRNAVGNDGQSFQGVWIGGLTQTTYLGVPDTEIITPLERASLLNWLHDNPQHGSHRPLGFAFDADSGGSIADIPRLVELLSRVGVSMIVIEDKNICNPGEKVNSLHETSGLQGQADMHEFAKMIELYAAAAVHKAIMITARIESFTVRIPKEDEAEETLSFRESLSDSLVRAELYRSAGADAIMIHSKSVLADEVLAFVRHYRSRDSVTPLVVVPTMYSRTTERTLYDVGANIIIYANHLMRAKIHAIGQFSEGFFAEGTRVFPKNAELRACLDARNYGCLLQKLLARGDMNDEASQYRLGAEIQATKNMTAASVCLLEGKMSSAADALLIPVNDLLKINNRQVSEVGNFVPANDRQ